MNIMIASIGMLLGIIGGLYFYISIVPFLVFSLWLWKIKIADKKSKYKIIRYIKCCCTKGKILCGLCCFLLGFVHIVYLEKGYTHIYNTMPQEVNVLATIVGEKEDKIYKEVYRIHIDKVEQTNVANGKEMLLEIKKGKGEQREFSYGDQVYFSGTYKVPTAQRNYRGFDYSFYLKTKKLYGTISTDSVSLKTHTSYNLLQESIGYVAKQMKKKANDLLPEDAAGMIMGLLIGKKEQIKDTIQENFRDSSLSHILAVSGAHVSYLILGIGFLLQVLPWNKKYQFILTTLFLGLFILLTGATPSVIRACLMAIYNIIAKFLRRKPNRLVSIAIPLFLLLFNNPYFLFSTSLQLSYGGTIGILLFFKILKQKWQSKENVEKVLNESKFKKRMNKLKQKIIDMLLVTFSANLVVFPIMAEIFQTVSATFFISNLLASPILGITILLGLITILLSFICLPMAQILACFLNFFLQILMKIASMGAKLPLSKVYIVPPSMGLLLFYFMILSLWYYLDFLRKKLRLRKIEKQILNKWQIIKKYKMKILSFLIIFSIVFPFLSSFLSQELKIYFIDVGQGDSCLIITPKGKTILIDGGGTLDTKSFDVGKQILLPYLLSRGITQIDYMLASHFDEDHIGRFINYFRNFISKTDNDY